MAAVNDISCVLAVMRYSRVPLSLGALWVQSLNCRVGGPEVTKAPLATGCHVCDVLQAVVQWARSRGHCGEHESVRFLHKIVYSM